MSHPATPSLAQGAAGLACAWVDFDISDVLANDEAAAILANADAAEEPRLRALSQAFESLRWVIAHRTDPVCRTLTDARLRSVRAQGWPRAVRLAEAAWAWARVYIPDNQPQALAMLREQHHRAEASAGLEADVPLIERFWRDVALSPLYCVAGDHDQSLAHGLSAEAMAAESGSELLQTIAAQALAFVYLSVGDIEGACAVLPAAVAAKPGTCLAGAGMPFNLLLALVVSRRFEEAAQLLRDHPLLLEPRRLVDLPALKALVARVRLAEGRFDEAADLPELRSSPAEGEVHTMAANRIWVTADVLIGLRQAREARRLLEQGLVAFRDAGIRLLPMNATQWHRSLADACEAHGDLPAALAALRESQAHNFNWLSASTRARLQDLHFAAPKVQPDDLLRRQRRRLRLVDLAVAEASGKVANDMVRESRFNLLTQVTHEVRNPLHGVVWMTSMLMMSNLDERQRKYIDLANSSAHIALNLCNDVLDLAKMDAGRFVLHPEPIDIAALVAECAQVFEAPALANGLSLHWHCDPALPAKVSGDRLRLQQVLMNLLSNATKFTPSGRIDVNVSWLGNEAGPSKPTLRLSVTDTGPGVSAELLPRLFQEFEQGDSRPVRAQGGAGLGLALCRQFVNLMGGEIGVDNGPKQGCTFWCLLPLRAV